MDVPGTSNNNDTLTQWTSTIECPICYTVYDKPMQMGCGHTICSMCIQQLINQVRNTVNEQQQQRHIHDHLIGLGGMQDQLDEAGNQIVPIPQLDHRNDGMIAGMMHFPPMRHNGATEIKCPECRKPTLVPPEGLPVNYRIQEIVQKMNTVLKDRNLVKLCQQCQAVLADGVYFDCGSCDDNGNKICSTCAIRHHNGHDLSEKKALTANDVLKMKKDMENSSHRAFQLFENCKPRLESIGGTVEAKISERLGSATKIFEFMLRDFDKKIKPTTTQDELTMDVEKAAEVENCFDGASGRLETMLAEIEDSVKKFLEPFEELQRKMNYPVVEAAPAPPPPVQAPAPIVPGEMNPHVAINILDNRNEPFPRRARLANPMMGNRGAVQHFNQVDRQRGRAPRPQNFGPPMPPGHPMMARGPPMNAPNGWHLAIGGPGGPPMGHLQMGPPQRRMAQQPRQQVIPNANQVIEWMGNFPPEMLRQMQQNVNLPLPPQMPNFGPPQPPPQQQQQVQQQHHHQQQVQPQQQPHPQQHPQMQQHVNQPMMHHHHHHHQPPQQQNQPPMMPPRGMVHRMAPPPLPPPNAPGYYRPPMNQQQHQLLHEQQQQLFQEAQERHMNQVRQHRHNIAQMEQLELEQRRQIQAALEIAREHVPQLNQQMNQLNPQPIPEVQEDVPRDPQNWGDMAPVDQEQNFDLFNGIEGEQGVEEEGEEIDEEQEPVQPFANQIDNNVPANYRAEDIDMIRFVEGDMPMGPVAEGPAGIENMEGMVGIEGEVRQEFQDLIVGEPNFVPFDGVVGGRDEFQQEQLQVIQEEQRPVNDDVDDVVAVEDLNMPHIIPQVEEDGDAQEEQDHLNQHPVATRRSQRREAAPEDADLRRSTRRSTRMSIGPIDETSNQSAASDGPSTSDGRAPSPTGSTVSSKRRRLDRKIKTEEPDDMDVEEGAADPVVRPTKRRAVTFSSSAGQSSSSSSAPTTRSQTRA